MEIVGWTVTIIFFIIAFLGLVYPIIPSALLMLLGFLSYGWMVGFEQLTLLFWVIQVLFILLLFAADTLANLVGIQRFGGSKAGMWGSTIGLLVGPFVIPVAGILLGPFLGAVFAEMIVTRTSIKEAIKVGVGSLVGFLTSIAAKALIQLMMIVAFLLTVLI